MTTEGICVDEATTDDLVAWASGLVATPFDTDHPPLHLARRLGADASGMALIDDRPVSQSFGRNM